MTTTRFRQVAFWLALLAFGAWDLHRSAPIDLWREPPLLAAGSGQAPAGGHCSAPK